MMRRLHLEMIGPLIPESVRADKPILVGFRVPGRRWRPVRGGSPRQTHIDCQYYPILLKTHDRTSR
jgi:hypothetical protein